MDSNLRKWCWNRTENILSMFYEHREIHKFWVKKVITKRQNILAVNRTLYCWGNNSVGYRSPADPTIFAGCPAGSSWQVPTSNMVPSHLLPTGCTNGTGLPWPVRMSLRQWGRTRWAQRALGQEGLSLCTVQMQHLLPSPPWTVCGPMRRQWDLCQQLRHLSQSQAGNSVLRHGQNILGLIWNLLKPATRVLRTYHLQQTAKS